MKTLSLLSLAIAMAIAVMITGCGTESKPTPLASTNNQQPTVSPTVTKDGEDNADYFLGIQLTGINKTANPTKYGAWWDCKTPGVYNVSLPIVGMTRGGSADFTGTLYASDSLENYQSPAEDEKSFSRVCGQLYSHGMGNKTTIQFSNPAAVGRYMLKLQCRDDKKEYKTFINVFADEEENPPQNPVSVNINLNKGFDWVGTVKFTNNSDKTVSGYWDLAIEGQFIAVNAEMNDYSFGTTYDMYESGYMYETGSLMGFINGSWIKVEDGFINQPCDQTQNGSCSVTLQPGECRNYNFILQMYGKGMTRKK